MHLSSIVIYLIIFLFGLIIGSFLNVCIYRIPRDLSIVKPGSHCPYCNKSIPLYLNIPVISYIWLRGRCSSCEKSISIQYPVVELLLGLLTMLVVLKLGITVDGLLLLLFLSCLVLIMFVDWQFMQIPRTLILSLIVIVLLYALRVSNPSFEDRFWGMLLGGGIFFSAAHIYKAIRKRNGLGAGDIYLAAILGLYFGWGLLPYLILMASILALAYALFLVRRKAKKLTTPIPFGAFLALSGIVFSLAYFF